MAITNFKLTTRKMAAYRKSKAAFKKLTTDREKKQFLADSEPFAMESWLTTSTKGMAWWPTLGGFLMFDDKWEGGFTTPEAAYEQAVAVKADYAHELAAMPTE